MTVFNYGNVKYSINEYQCEYQVFQVKFRLFSICFSIYKAKTTIILVYLYTHRTIEGVCGP